MVKTIAAGLAQTGRGVTILTPSAAAARTWTDIAEYPDTSATVAEQIAAMQAGATHGPIVLANRYDGIDLAGNACRLLVIDDLPKGTTTYDTFRMNVVTGAAVSSLLAQRLEQGMGRGTRGGADHCVIVLIGSKLVGWIGRTGNLAFLTASTRVQLKMGQEVSEAVTTVEEFAQTIAKCLDRDPDWIGYHASELSAAAHSAPVDILALRVASAERRAFRLQRLGQFQNALSGLEALISDATLAGDPQRRAWLTSLAARIAYQMEDDPKGQTLQTTAFAVNNNVTARRSPSGPPAS